VSVVIRNWGIYQNMLVGFLRPSR